MYQEQENSHLEWPDHTGCHSKISQPGWFKRQKLISSHFWRLEVQDKMLVGLVSSEACLFADGHLLSMPYGHSVCTRSVFLRILISSSYKDIDQAGLGVTLKSST